MTTHQLVMLVWSLVGLSVFIYLFFQTAPYGRHQERGWGFEISSRWGWILMESPAFYLMLIFLVLNFSNSSNFSIFASILFMIHYFNRSFIWPVRARIKNKSMPVTIALSAFIFNFINVYIQGTWLFYISDYATSHFYSAAFFLGLSLFFIGMFINIKSDEILFSLIKKNEGYQVPKGFMYKYVSCPNYLGEFIEWLGWAIMTFSTAGFVFFFWTVANLLPRAVANHQWYKDNFEDYPKDRKAVIPKLL